MVADGALVHLGGGRGGGGSCSQVGLGNLELKRSLHFCILLQILSKFCKLFGLEKSSTHELLSAAENCKLFVAYFENPVKFVKSHLL